MCSGISDSPLKNRSICSFVLTCCCTSRKHSPREDCTEGAGPVLAQMLRGRIDLFSTDSLIDMLARLGVRVRFVLKPARGRVA